MLYLLLPQLSPRLRYTLALVFERVWPIPYEVLIAGQDEVPAEVALLDYAGQRTPHALRIPNSRFLLESRIRSDLPRLKQRELPQLFAVETTTDFDLPYDLFAAIFYLVSEYETYQHQSLDQHARYRAADYLWGQCRLEELPLIHLYVSELKQALQKKFPFFQANLPPAKNSKPSPQLTFDIDFPWRYLHKGWQTTLGGLAKDVLRRDWAQLWDRIQVLGGKADPHDSFAEIQRLSPPERTTFFFLLDRHSPHDSRFTWRNPALRALIQAIQQAGYRCGIHPSYLSSDQTEYLKKEVHQLAEILGEPVRHSRQHFLRYRMPDTFRHLLALGIREEYSACLFETGGFPQGMAIPYPWFDVEKNEATDLIRVPTIIMDRTLQQYLKLDPAAAVAKYAALQAQTEAVGGTFTALFHNDSLSEKEDWQGWSDAIREMIGMGK
jgi:peptidoglycan/xylan/chitin deacetylase (PgdA/CDA1 family)